MMILKSSSYYNYLLPHVWTLGLKINYSLVRLKGLARKCIDNIVDIDVEVEPQSKRLLTESSNDSSVDAVPTSKVWECFTEILHDCGETTNTDVTRSLVIAAPLGLPIVLSVIDIY